MTVTQFTAPLLHHEADVAGGQKACKGESHTGLTLHVIASCSIMFAGGFRATMLFPFASQMTEALRGTETSVGFWTGVLLASQSLGMLTTSALWARFSNAYGRRAYLFVGLTSNIFTLILVTMCNDYWTILFLRGLAGLMDSTLPIMRTSLREAFQSKGVDDTMAFSLVQVAFGASSVTGPALGGLLYGQQLTLWGRHGPPWLMPYVLCMFLYAAALILTYFGLEETVEETVDVSHTQSDESLESPESACRTPTQKFNLMQQTPFLLLLVMCGGHSYVFTGWELAFPFVAHLPGAQGGEDLLPADIGTVFLVGSVGLILYNLLLYPKLAQFYTVIDIWKWSLTMPVLVIMIFPRLLNELSSEGSPFRSLFIQFVNYASQFLISVLLGSNFTSIQLLANSYVASLPNSSKHLARVNCWLNSIQALVRSISPSLTGAMFGARQSNVPFLASEGNSLAFDSLAVVLVICCLLPAVKFARYNSVSA